MTDNISKILESLSPEEYAATMKILDEVSDTGKSNTLTSLYNTDYTEVPVSIDEFIDSPKYAGWFTNNGRDIYPYWRERLREIFDENASYSEIAFTGCLSGDTMIPLLNGTSVSMKELADRDEIIDEYVTSYDIESKSYVKGHLVDAFSTGIKDTYTILLDNGKSIRATSNHKFMGYNSNWICIDTGMCNGTKLLNGSTVTSIEYYGKEEVYDLTVEKYHNFMTEINEILSNSIGCGKSHIAILGLAYCLYKLMCLRDPHAYYGIAKGGLIYIVFFNNTLALSQGVAYTKFQSLVQHSPWFLERGSVTGKKYLEYIPNGNKIAFSLGSGLNHSIGKDILCMTGDTKIYTEHGIQKLSSLKDKSVRVYTKYDDGSIELTESPVKVVLTKKVYEVYRITISDGSELKCTENHRFRLSDGTYCEAKDLYIGSVLDSNTHIVVDSISIIHDRNFKLIDVYDVIDVPETHNFLVETNDGYIVSHNCAIMDEVSFAKGDNVSIEKSKIMSSYLSIKERISSRYIVNGKNQGKLFLVSSKKSEYSFLENYIRKQQGKPGVYVADAVLWKIKSQRTYSGVKFHVAIGGSNMPSRIIEDPSQVSEYERQGYQIEEVPIEFKSSFELDIDKAIMNICGISISEVTKFFTYDNVSRCYMDAHNPFTINILTIGTKDNLSIRDFFLPELVPYEIYNKPLFLGFDFSITGDRTGISCVAAMGYRYQNRYNMESGDIVPTKELVYRHVFSIGIECPYGAEISFQKTRNFVYYLKNELRWNIKSLSVDGFQSRDFLQQMETMGFDDVELISLDRSPDGYLCLRSAINEERLKLFEIRELETELIRLEQNNVTGKIDHPVDGSKDISDSLCSAVFNASQHDKEFSFGLAEGAEVFQDTNYVGSTIDYRDRLLQGMVPRRYDPSMIDIDYLYEDVSADKPREVLDEIQKAHPEMSLKDAVADYIQNVRNQRENNPLPPSTNTQSNDNKDTNRKPYNRYRDFESEIQNMRDMNDGILLF